MTSVSLGIFGKYLEKLDSVGGIGTFPTISPPCASNAAENNLYDHDQKQNLDIS